MPKFLAFFLTLSLFGAGCLSTPVFDLSAPEQETAPQEEVMAPVEAVAEPEDVETPTSSEAAAAPVETVPSAPAKTTTPAPVTTTPAPAPKPTVDPTKVVGKVYVTITDTGFSPQVMAISAGDTVVWTNKGTKNHTVASDGALIYDSGNIPPGASWSRTYMSVGSYGYHCGAHPTEKGTIVVR
ncbi:cupredoxin domain-containing protein [Candidatus Uhrbacteria bacterium]|nr:cupredoxin domain-containing protein [Candidatus Uhrbacteria bacterium]